MAASSSAVHAGDDLGDPLHHYAGLNYQTNQPPQNPGLDKVLQTLKDQAEPNANLDATLIRTDRVAARTQRGNHLWY